MYPWYYVWSPRHRIFHEVLKATAGDLSGISLRPISIPQEMFAPRVPTTHRLTGVGIKLYCLLKSLQAHPNQHILVSDVDVLVPEKDLAEKLKAYEGNDITAMIEMDSPETYAIGFMLIKSTPDVRRFFETILQRIHKEVAFDQDIFNEEIHRFPGTHGYFSTQDFIQSNRIRKDIWDTGKYSVIQCLGGGESYADRLCGKLATLIYYYNITPLLSYVDRDTIQNLQDYVLNQSPTHYLASIHLDEIYGPRTPLTTKQLSENP